MKYLHLLRHGDAARGTPEMSDHARPLSTEGQAEIARIGAWMQGERLTFDTVLCSSALRTRQTFDALKLGAQEGRVSFLDPLYLASSGDILQIVQQIPAGATHVLLIGHNPGLREFCALFARIGAPKALEHIALHYPTGALCTLRFDIDAWPDIPASGATLEHYIEPASL